MKYVDQINSFWDYATIHPLSTGQVSLYFALLHVCNRSYWTEWFPVSNQVLSVLTGLSRSGILKARNELKQRSLIDFKERGTKGTLYKLTILNSKQDSKQYSMQESKQDSVQDSMQKSKQESTIVNSVQESKQESVQTIANSKQESKQAIYSIYNNIDNKDKRQIEDKRQPLPFIEHFEDFWLTYPNQQRRTLTEEAYCDLVLSETVTESELVQAAQNYAEYIKMTKTTREKIYLPNNFLAKRIFIDFLPGTYQKPELDQIRQETSSVLEAPRKPVAGITMAAEEEDLVSEEELEGEDWMNYGPGWRDRHV